MVIGIIALLISVLLPALGKARQQANLIDCQSRLRQMGQALAIYSSESNGMLPYGSVKYNLNGGGGDQTTPWLAGTTPQSAEENWYWTFTLSQEIQSNILGPDKLVHNLSPIFHDVDTIDAQYGRYINHYTCNPKVFPNNYDNYWDAGGNVIAPQFVKNKKFSNIRPSTVFLIWDAPQVGDWGPGNISYEQATEIDGNAETLGSYLFTGESNSAYSYNRPCLPGGGLNNYISASVSQKQQKQLNRDIISSSSVPNNPDYFATHLRFRHLTNTTMNALCVDGHVETRAVGTFMVLDICINPPG